MKVIIPDALKSYTKVKEVTASGATISHVFDDLDRQFPGLRFRVINELDELRPNIKVFINGERRMSLDAPISEDDELFIMQALSGG